MDGRKFLSLVQGKKTYLVVAIGLVLGVIQGLDDSKIITVHIPWYVDALLGFLGLATLRKGVSTQTEQATVAFVNLAEVILQAVSQVQQTMPTKRDIKQSNQEAVAKVAAVVQTTEYKKAPTEEARSDLLNESQLPKGLK